MNLRRSPALLFGGLFILLVAQLLNTFQIRASNEKALTQAFVSRNLIPARDLKLSFERGMGFGKPLSLFSGTDKLFAGIQGRYEGVGYMALTSIGLEVYAESDQGSGRLASISQDSRPIFPSIATPADLGGYRTVIAGDQVLVALPLYFDDRDLKGIAWLGFPRKAIDERLAAESSSAVIFLGVSLLLSFLIFLLAFRPLVENFPEGRKLSAATRATILIVAILFTSLLATTAVTNTRFIPGLIEVYRNDVALLARSQAQEFRRLADLGLEPAHWKGAEKQLFQKVSSTHEVRAMAITDAAGKTLFAASRDQSFASSSGVAVPAGLEIADASAINEVLSASTGGQATGYLKVELDQGFFQGILMDRILDAFTLLVVTIVFSAELLLALGLLSRWKKRERIAELGADNEGGMKVIRFTAFLFFMAEFLPLPFLPLFISDFYSRSPLTILSLTSDAVKSLPFSAHLLGVMLCVPVVGALLTRFSLKRLFMVNGFLLLAGNFAAAFSPDLSFLMFCRFLSGLGYGGVISASAALVVQTTDPEHRTRGFAAWGAGFAAASICAVVLGGTLVTYLGYRAGMIVAASISILLGIFILAFHPGKPPKAEATTAVKLRFADFFSVFRDKDALLALLFASLPVQLAFFGLFQFTLPLLMSQVGISDSNIGRILTIYGLMSLAAPALARYADRTRRERLLIVAGNIITGMVLTVLFVNHTPLALLLVVAAIGVGGLMFDTCFSAFLTQTKAAKRLGDARFISIFLTWEKLFTIFVPILVGTMMSAFGYLNSAAILGVVIASGSLIFLVFARTPGSAAAGSPASK
ncbi:MAG: MFS transporter [Rectinemataceae bacterium]